MTTYNPTPITGYSEGSITSDDKPVRCVETFDDNRHDNVNLYFEIDGKFYNVHPCAADGRYPVRWIDNSAPVGWPEETDDTDWDDAIDCINEWIEEEGCSEEFSISHTADLFGVDVSELTNHYRFAKS